MKTQSVHNWEASIESSTSLCKTIRRFKSGVICLFLMLFVASCKTACPQLADKVVYLQPPETLLLPTPAPEPPLSEVQNNAELMRACLAGEAALKMCNADKERMRNLPEPTKE